MKKPFTHFHFQYLLAFACLYLFYIPTARAQPTCTRITVQTATGSPVEDVQLTLTPVFENNCTAGDCSGSSQLTHSSNLGNYFFCPCNLCSCTDCKKYTVTPFYDENPLNGVTTFDLVLISKHILGLDTFDSPYKRIAADVDHSNKITTGDIVGLRKVVLGIIDTFPQNTSWRFVDSDYSFSNPYEPWGFPESATLNDITQNNLQGFVAIKVGDVNNSAIGVGRHAVQSVSEVTWPSEPAAPGDVVTIPIVYTGSDTLSAFQMGFSFDPSILELISPSQGDLSGYTSQNFGLTELSRGRIRTLWFADPSDYEQNAVTGEVLFYLSFRVKGRVTEDRLPLRLDDSVLANLAWGADESERRIEYRAEPDFRQVASRTASPTLRVSCAPNPGSSELNLTIESAQAGKGRVALFSPFGVRVYVQDLTLQTGTQQVRIDTAALPAGVYIWKVYNSVGKKVQGHWVSNGTK